MRVYEGMKLGFQALLTHVRSLQVFWRCCECCKLCPLY